MCLLFLDFFVFYIFFVWYVFIACIQCITTVKIDYGQPAVMNKLTFLAASQCVKRTCVLFRCNLIVLRTRYT